MNNPESVEFLELTPQLMAARTCKISGYQRKSEVLKLRKNSQKDDHRFRPSQQGLA
jgi:hypothetical protein